MLSWEQNIVPLVYEAGGPARNLLHSPSWCRTASFPISAILEMLWILHAFQLALSSGFYLWSESSAVICSDFPLWWEVILIAERDKQKDVFLLLAVIDLYCEVTRQYPGGFGHLDCKPFICALRCCSEGVCPYCAVTQQLMCKENCSLREAHSSVWMHVALGFF